MKKARTKLVILGNFQKWFIWNFTIYTALFMAMLGTGFVVWFKFIAQEILQLTSLLSQSLVDLIDQNLKYSILFTALLVICLISVSAWASLLFSRRIAGPLFAFARHLESCEKSGKLSHLKLRKDDLFNEMAEKFNSLVDRVNHPKDVE